MNKIFIDANQLQRDSFALAKKVIDSGYRPTFLIGLWRGGTPIAITVHEVLEYCRIQSDHISVRVSSYRGIDQRTPEIKIHDLTYVRENITPQDSILIVDDIHDTGLSMARLIDEINLITRVKELKIAVTYYKPEKSQVDFEPDFYVKVTNGWVVFPHELCGLSDQELEQDKPDINEIKDLLVNDQVE